jgi:hypothetical protein
VVTQNSAFARALEKLRMEGGKKKKEQRYGESSIITFASYSENPLCEYPTHVCNTVARRRGKI